MSLRRHLRLVNGGLALQLPRHDVVDFARFPIPGQTTARDEDDDGVGSEHNAPADHRPVELQALRVRDQIDEQQPKVADLLASAQAMTGLLGVLRDAREIGPGVHRLGRSMTLALQPNHRSACRNEVVEIQRAGGSAQGALRPEPDCLQRLPSRV